MHSMLQRSPRRPISPETKEVIVFNPSSAPSLFSASPPSLYLEPDGESKSGATNSDITAAAIITATV
jgi:hypothetical protein